MSKLEGFDKTIFGDLVSRTFDHHHFLFTSDINQIECGIVHLFVGWIDHEFAVNLSQAHTSNGSIPWNIRNHEGGGCTINHQYISFVFHVGGKKVTN